MITPYAVLLGLAQDAGRPQAGCMKDCCLPAQHDPALVRHPVSLGLCDAAGALHLVEVTRSLAHQLAMLQSSRATVSQTESDYKPDSFGLASAMVTHAHLGHVDGLGQFGPPAMNLDRLPLHCSLAFCDLTQRNPDWFELLDAGNIELQPWESNVAFELGPGLEVTPIPVPHRSEQCDMHALLFAGPSASLLFLPDHDDWAGTLGAVGAADLRQWFESLQADIILLDGTFWSLDELQHRDQMEVPHPPVRETVELLGPRQKGDPELFFVHLNHTNPLLIETSAEVGEVRLQGWDIAHEGQRWDL